MRKTLAALTLLASLAMPSMAMAAKDLSYDQTKNRLGEARNMLVRYCQSFAPLDARAMALAAREGFTQPCGEYWNGWEFGDIKLRYERRRDTVSLQTVDIWSFRIPVEGSHGGFFDVALVDIQTHTDNTFKADDPRQTVMEVIGFSNIADKTPVLWTNGEAWHGYSMKTRSNRKLGSEPPSLEAFDAGMWSVIRGVKDLRFHVREAYRFK